MNLTEESSVDQLRDLIATQDDNEANHILWVDQTGEVHLTSLPSHLTPASWAAENKDRIRFRFETFLQGDGFIGTDAANDVNWISRLFSSLVRLWEAGATGYRDHG